jgi:hypothetical protein
MRAVAYLLALPILAAAASADGGALVARCSEHGLAVAVFVAPQPLCAGPVDASVLVQDERGAPVVDAVVHVRFALERPSGAPEPPDPRGCGPLGVSAPAPNVLAAPATRAAARNRCLYAAAFDLTRAGTWSLAVEVERAGRTATCSAVLEVGARESTAGGLWACFALPPVAIALYVLNRLLKRRTGDPWPVIARPG